MGKRVARVLMGVAVVSGMLAASPVRVEAQLSTQPFAAYGNASTIQLNALQPLLSPPLANVNAALSAGVVNSTGLNTLVQNQFGNAVGPPQPGKNAYARGTGLEVGVSPLTGEQNDILLSGLAEANAPPPSPLVTAVTPINVPGVLEADTLRGEAQATYDPQFCPVGKPLTYGLGYAENLSLLPSALVGGLVGTSDTGDSVSQTRTVTYMIPNGDGTFGLRAQSEAIIAPISVSGTQITIEVVGPVGFQVTATGIPGDPRNGVEFTDTPVITVSLAGIPVLGTPIALGDILGPAGLDIPIPGIANVSVGAPPKGLSGTGFPDVAPNGTAASASMDIIRLDLLPILGLLDVSIGHFEGAVSVPPGGIRCNLPVSKIATPDPVQVGQDVVFTISIPSDPALFAALFACDLVNIAAIDTVDVASGTVGFTILSASNGGVIGPGNVVTWPNLGTYSLGDPPIQVSLTVHINSASGDAVIRDIVDVSASLGNCQGSVEGDDLVLGSGLIEGGAVTGHFELFGPTIAGGTLAATGGTSAPLVMGGFLVLGGLGLVRLRRTLIQRRV